MHKKVFLFDLDGTLFDTAPDFEATINYFRAQQNAPLLPASKILPSVNQGAAAMTELAFSMSEAEENFLQCKQQFLEKYTANIGKFGRLYQGMGELLSNFDNKNHAWGIATNKPRKYAELYLTFLPYQPTLLICGDDVEKPKPDAMMLLKAAAQLNVPASHIGYAGDHERDIVAANSAGMYSVAATYGYLTEHECATKWQADKIAQSPMELAQVIYTFTEMSTQT